MMVRYECDICHESYATVEEALACEALGRPELPAYLAARVGEKVAAFCASAVWVFRLDEWRVGYAEDDAARMTHTLWCFERGKGLAFDLEVMDPYCSNFMTTLWDGEGAPLEADIRRTTSDWVDWCVTYGLEPDLDRCVWFAKMLPDAQAIVRAAVRDRVVLMALVGSGCLELRDGADNFLREHHDVQEVMVEAIVEARKYFGPGTCFAAERFIDPEGEAPVTMFLVVKVHVDVDPARAAMDQFNAAWWFDNLQRARLLSISIEYHGPTLTEQIDAQMRSASEHDIEESLYVNAESPVDALPDMPPDDEAMAACRLRWAIGSRF